MCSIIYAKSLFIIRPSVIKPFSYINLCAQVPLHGYILFFFLNSPSKAFQCASFSKAEVFLRQPKSLYPVLTKHFNCISSHSIIETSLKHTQRASESIGSSYPLIHPHLHPPSFQFYSRQNFMAFT